MIIDFRLARLTSDCKLSPRAVGRGFRHQTSLKYLIPPRTMIIFLCTLPPPQTDTKISCTPPPPQILCSSYTDHFLGCCFTVLMLCLYTFSMCKCLKRLQVNLATNVWKTENNSIKFKTHKYNTECISGKTLDMEMNKSCLHHFFNLILWFLSKV